MTGAGDVAARVRALCLVGSPGAIASVATPRRRAAFRLAWLAAAAGLLIALPAPLIQIDGWLFGETLSVLDVVRGLWGDGEIPLAAVVAAVSIVFPAAKLLLALDVFFATPRLGRRFRRRLAMLEWTSKWSLAEVMVVAVTIAVTKSGYFLSLSSGWAIWPFLAFVAASAVAIAILRRASEAASARDAAMAGA